MYFIILLGSLVLAGAGFAVRRRSTGLGQAFIAFGCIGCIAAIVWQVRSTMFNPESKIPDRAYLMVGSALNTGVQSAIRGQRGTIVMVFPKSLNDSAVENYADAFGGPLLRGHREWDLQIAKVDVPSKELKAGTLSQARFKEVISQYPNAIAFISFAGVPVGLETLFSTGPIPPILIYDGTGSGSWVEPLKQRRLRLVIVRRTEAELQNAQPVGLPGDIFSQFYYLATPENATEIAAKTAAVKK